MIKLLGVVLPFYAACLVGGAAAATRDDPPPAPAVEPTRFGVADDFGKYSDDGGSWFFGKMEDVGLVSNRISVRWDPARPTEIVEQAFLDRAVPVAEENGIRLTFSVEIGKARAITGSRTGARQYVLFLQQVAERYPYVTEFVIGNEPNLSRFWQPQFNRRGAIVSASAYQALLGMSYDALKAIDPNITVVGLGLSPRGNGNPRAKSNISTQPVKFIAELGRAYRRSGRNRPIMDVLGFHPYPWRDRDTLEKGYRWPNAGVANLDRIKQAVWDAFHGTAQPVFAEGLPEPPAEPPAEPPVEPPSGPPAEPPPPSQHAAEKVEHLTFKLDEVGWQVRIPASSRAAYHGRESVKPTTELNQARIYAKLVERAVCDRSIRELLFFGLVDERNLDRWQAGLMRADKTLRLSYLTVKNAIAKTRGLCAGAPLAWEHTEEVIGARANFGVPGRRFQFTAMAEEDATYKAAVFRISGAAVSPATRRAIARSLASRTSVQATATTSGALRAYWKSAVKLRPRALAPGYYVYAIRFRAAMNPARWSVVVSGAFQVR